jgi:hypothetical protein
MGVFDNISDRRLDRLGRYWLAGFLLAAGLSAAPALAQSPDPAVIAQQPHHAVSTSPSGDDASTTLDPSASRKTANATPDRPPLTRAATRLRIEEMSPLRWLAHYGDVSIGHRE